MEKPMHKSLKIFALAAAGTALSAIPFSLAAQEKAPADPPANAPAEASAPAPAMTAAQEAAMQAWPADKQQAFKAWPAETQEYFWSLSQERQKMFWALSDSDKVALSQMAEPQRESVWAQIEARTRSLQSG
jgi:hypothetical protein